MINHKSDASHRNKGRLTDRRYLIPFLLITLLFFLWGFARAILDVLNKHFQDSFSISISQSALIQVTTYLAYFLMALPAGMFINRYGYRRGVVFGLSLFGIGALLFIPSSHLATNSIFYAFLCALFILGCGLTFLETAANPYATELGPAATATARLNLSQTFNGLGSCLAPALIGGYLFSGGEIVYPYLIMGIVVLVIALIFSRTSLPEIYNNAKEESAPAAAAAAPPQEGDQRFLCQTIHRFRAVWKHKIFVFGLFALLMYEMAEISINSYFINFTTMPHMRNGVVESGLLSPVTASMWLSGALLLFMLGRFIGSILMTMIKAERALTIAAAGCIVCIGTVFLAPGKTAIYAIMANYFFEAIMFPTIFSLALRGMGDMTKTASSMLMMTPVGGCFFLVVGIIAEAHMLLPFVVPFLGYIVIFLFAYTVLCRKGLANITS